VVNVGRRQSERHHASNVFFVPADREAIVRQIRKIIDDDETKRQISACENPFGDGHTAERVAELLATTTIDEKLLNKDLSY
jgi:GDP/UDP-N,N'-diacetylbacillosamine 2-epimerase (hydrolysing)